MSGFKDSTRTRSGHHHWDGGSIGGGTGGTINRRAQGGSAGSSSSVGRRDGMIPPKGLARGGAVDKVDASPGHAEVYPKEGDRMQGNAVTLRKEAPTQELAEHGGRTPLTAGFKKGGPARHFHVHHHHHAKSGKITTNTKSYRSHETKAEGFAEGGHVHDSTNVPAGGPDYKRGGKTRPVRKNAGGAMYAPGGAVAPPAMGMSQPAMGSALGRLAMRPQGLPGREGPPMRRPIAIPRPGPLARAGGGKVPMRAVAKQEVAKHVRTAPPRGHGVK